MQPEPTLAAICDQIMQAPLGPHRRLIAVAGAPGSGKSTTAKHIADALAAHGLKVAVVPMDGFHLDNRLLDVDGSRARKGAPHTFDAEGLIRLVTALQSNDAVVYPLFDRSRDIAIAGAGRVDADVDTVLIEGNYLLLNTAPWNRLAACWALTISLATPREVLHARLVQRWLDHGMTRVDAEARALGNDMKNAEFITANENAADIRLTENPK
ncbi:division plane positioning ATPase MipZ [Tateyamaria pelophila]|uniref:division plane positioning ATPase MipZ n=1 Tax=Tateyamaria pelophila TaxID=328415 RepID=UPI001CBBC282|nr:division plane positioning ATPase MipZ [Tateyamaria pelophila]